MPVKFDDDDEETTPPSGGSSSGSPYGGSTSGSASGSPSGGSSSGSPYGAGSASGSTSGGSKSGSSSSGSGKGSASKSSASSAAASAPNPSTVVKLEVSIASVMVAIASLALTYVALSLLTSKTDFVSRFSRGDLRTHPYWMPGLVKFLRGMPFALFIVFMIVYLTFMYLLSHEMSWVSRVCCVIEALFLALMVYYIVPAAFGVELDSYSYILNSFEGIMRSLCVIPAGLVAPYRVTVGDKSTKTSTKPSRFVMEFILMSVSLVLPILYF